MVFAVHSGSRGAIGGDKAASSIEPKLNWILNGRPLECFPSWRAGYRHRQCQDTSFKLWREAENATLTAPMAVGRSGDASRSRYISVPPDAGDGGSARFTINLPETRAYFVWLRALAPGAGARRINVRVDTQPVVAATLPTAPSFAWKAGAAGSIPASLLMSAGSHMLELRRRVRA